MQCASCGTGASAGERFCKKCGAPIDTSYAVSPAAFDSATPVYSANPPYAGFWRRAGGYIIDYVLYVIVYALSISVFVKTGASIKALPLAALLSLAGSWIYTAGMDSSKLQGTLGRLAVGIKVTDLEGRQIGFGRATGRYFAHIITGFTLGIGLVMVVFTARRQALHDMIAGTLVVRRDRSQQEVAAAGPAPRVSAWIAVLAVLGFILLVPVGIGVIAAIAIPAYQNYTVRAQVTEGLIVAQPYKAAVVRAVGHRHPLREINLDTLKVVPLPESRYVDSVTVTSSLVVITYGRAANKAISGKKLILAPAASSDNDVIWVCGYQTTPPELTSVLGSTHSDTTVPKEYLPMSCRVGS